MCVGIFYHRSEVRGIASCMDGEQPQRGGMSIAGAMCHLTALSPSGATPINGFLSHHVCGLCHPSGVLFSV